MPERACAQDDIQSKDEGKTTAKRRKVVKGKRKTTQGTGQPRTKGKVCKKKAKKTAEAGDAERAAEVRARIRPV